MRTGIALLMAVATAVECKPAAPPLCIPAGSEFRQLIGRLNSNDFGVRERATRQLLQWETAEPYLRQALLSGEPEVTSRARAILAEFESRRLRKAKEAIRAEAALMRVDFVAERVTHWHDDGAEPVCWQAVLDIGHFFLDLEKQKHHRIRERSRQLGFFPQKEFSRYMIQQGVRVVPPGRSNLVFSPPLDTMASHAFLLRGTRVHVKKRPESGLVATLTVSSDKVDLESRMVSSIILSGGSVELGLGHMLVVVCDGDFDGDELMDSVVVARGAVRLRTACANCVILAGGNVSFTDAHRVKQSTVHTAGVIQQPTKGRVEGCTLKEHVTDPLYPVQFFETRMIGVEVGQSPLGVHVTAVGFDKAFSRAGLRRDDLVVKVDGIAVPNPEEFRRRVRKRLIAVGDMTLDVRRGGHQLSLRIPLEDARREIAAR